MVLPSHLQGNLTPTEINFLAENELITILPRYSIKKINLIGVCLKYYNSHNKRIHTNNVTGNSAKLTSNETRESSTMGGSYIKDPG